VLVVDDDAEVRAVFGEYLGLRGFRVLEASNGLEALLQVKRELPQAIILDLAMPRLGGIETLKRIVKFDPTIAVVVLTGETDPEVHRQASLLGARAVLTKPLDPADLFLALTKSHARQADPGPRLERSRPGAPASAPRGASRGRVLVVDDEPDVREMLDEFATLKGYSVRAVASGADALRAIVEDPPDVVLLDIEMPGLAGTDALVAIRAVAPDVQVIMVSGTSDAALAQRALARGAFDYVTKPVDMEHLARSVETAMTMKGLESSPGQGHHSP
jgi:two-component system sensor histidine kinase/response regulator